MVEFSNQTIESTRIPEIYGMPVSNLDEYVLPSRHIRIQPELITAYESHIEDIRFNYRPDILLTTGTAQKMILPDFLGIYAAHQQHTQTTHENIQLLDWPNPFEGWGANTLIYKYLEPEMVNRAYEITQEILTIVSEEGTPYNGDLDANFIDNIHEPLYKWGIYQAHIAGDTFEYLDEFTREEMLPSIIDECEILAKSMSLISQDELELLQEIYEREKTQRFPVISASLEERLALMKALFPDAISPLFDAEGNPRRVALLDTMGNSGTKYKHYTEFFEFMGFPADNFQIYSIRSSEDAIKTMEQTGYTLHPGLCIGESVPEVKTNTAKKHDLDAQIIDIHSIQDHPGENIVRSRSKAYWAYQLYRESNE